MWHNPQVFIMYFNILIILCQGAIIIRCVHNNIFLLLNWIYMLKYSKAKIFALYVLMFCYICYNYISATLICSYNLICIPCICLMFCLLSCVSQFCSKTFFFSFDMQSFAKKMPFGNLVFTAHCHIVLCEGHPRHRALPFCSGSVSSITAYSDADWAGYPDSSCSTFGFYLATI